MEVDVSGYEVEERVSFVLLREKDSLDTSIIGYAGGDLPGNLKDRSAFDAWLALVRPGGGCYYDHILVRDSDEIVNMRTNKPVFYRLINALIGPSDNDREEAKKHWHSFVRDNMNAAKLKKKAFEVKDAPQPTTPAQTEKKKFAYFRPYHEYVVKMFGKMFSSKEIRQFLLEDHGVDVSVSLLQSFYKFHEPLITKQISSFKESLEDVRLGYKRSRLEEYAWIYHNLKKDFKNPKTPIAKKTAFSKEMQSCLKAIKDEIEGDTIKIEANLTVTQQINVHAAKKILDRKTVALVAIARAAMNEGVEPAGLLYEMEKSYYRKYNAFLGSDPNDPSLELPDQTYTPNDYDMDRLEEQSSQQLRVLKENEDAIVKRRMEMRDKIRDAGVREKLKEALAISRQALSESDPDLTV